MEIGYEGRVERREGGEREGGTERSWRDEWKGGKDSEELEMENT